MAIIIQHEKQKLLRKQVNTFCWNVQTLVDDIRICPYIKNGHSCKGIRNSKGQRTRSGYWICQQEHWCQNY